GFFCVEEAPAGCLAGSGAPAQEGACWDEEVDQGRQGRRLPGAVLAGVVQRVSGRGWGGPVRAVRWLASGIGSPVGLGAGRVVVRWRGPGRRGGRWLDAVEGVAALSEVGEGQ